MRRRAHLRRERGDFPSAFISSLCCSSSSMSKRRRFIHGRCRCMRCGVFGLLEMIVFVIVLAHRVCVCLEERRISGGGRSLPRFVLARARSMRLPAGRTIRPALAADDGPGVLRDRDDDGDGARVRLGALRFRGLSLRRRARPIWMIVSGRVAQKMGPDHQAAVRPNGRSEMGDIDGRMREFGRRLRQLRGHPRRRHDRAGRRVHAGLPPDARWFALRRQFDPAADPPRRTRRNLRASMILTTAETSR